MTDPRPSMFNSPDATHLALAGDLIKRLCRTGPADTTEGITNTLRIAAELPPNDQTLVLIAAAMICAHQVRHAVASAAAVGVDLEGTTDELVDSWVEALLDARPDGS